MILVKIDLLRSTLAAQEIDRCESPSTESVRSIPFIHVSALHGCTVVPYDRGDKNVVSPVPIVVLHGNAPIVG